MVYAYIIIFHFVVIVLGVSINKVSKQISVGQCNKFNISNYRYKVFKIQLTTCYNIYIY